MTDNKKNITCWIITEGMAGTENQCVAVAEYLAITPEIIQIGLKQPWKTLSPWFGFECAGSFTKKLLPPWPDILIAAGRKSIAASRYIKKQSGGKTFTVQLQDPKTSPDQFDLVAVPFHDKTRGDNVIVTHGAPNRITKQKLDTARTEFSSLFKSLPSPRIAVVIGGNSKTHKLNASRMRQTVNQLKQLNGSLMITASRRTGEDNMTILRNELKDTNAYIWDGTGDNPYFGMLAWADHIIVTADSVSMLCDAGTTGKPVHMLPLEGKSKRFDFFHSHLQEIGAMRPLHNINGGSLENWTYEPLNDAEMVAEAINEAMQRRYG